MKTKELDPVGEVLVAPPGSANVCGGAHEISGIEAPLFLCGGVGGR